MVRVAAAPLDALGGGLGRLTIGETGRDEARDWFAAADHVASFELGYRRRH